MDDQPVDVETEIPAPALEPGLEDEEGVDAWRDDFALPVPAGSKVERLDSRRWLVLPERYFFQPLDALAAAQECDKLTGSPGGSHFIGLAVELREQRSALLAMAREDYDEETAQEMVDVAMIDHVSSGLERLVKGLEGSGVALTEVALGWLKKCNVRRVPLPGSTDTGGLVAKEGGPAGWAGFYKGRYVFLYRLAAAVLWATVAPFFFDVRPATSAR